MPQSNTMGGRHPDAIKIRATAQRKRHLWSRRCDILVSYDSNTRHRVKSVPGLFCVSIFITDIHCSQYRVHDILGGLKLSVRQALQTLRQHVYCCRSLIVIITVAK